MHSKQLLGTDSGERTRQGTAQTVASTPVPGALTCDIDAEPMGVSRLIHSNTSPTSLMPSSSHST
jgi:hypothetical protein